MLLLLLPPRLLLLSLGWEPYHAAAKRTHQSVAAGQLLSARLYFKGKPYHAAANGTHQSVAA
jgi:hypothetical protein